MARYYDNSAQSQRFQPGTTVRSDEVDAKFDSVASGFSSVESDIDRSLKLTADNFDHEISATATQRRNKVVGFDGQGAMALLGGFSWRGDYASGTEYFVNDVFRDPTTKNLLVVDERHTGGASIDTTKVSLAIDVSDVENAKQAAQAAEQTAKDWATKTDGTVDGSDFSAKHYATSPDVITIATDLQGANTIGVAAADIANINTAATNISDINTTATDIARINTVASDISNLNAVADDLASVVTVAGDLSAPTSSVDVVASVIDDVTTVADDSSEINAVAGSLAPINTVADDLLSPNLSTDQIYDLGSIADVDEGGDGSVDGYVITAVNNLGTYQTVANNIADVQLVAADLDEVKTLGAISADIQTVAGADQPVRDVAANLNPVTAVAAITTQVSNVASVTSDVTLVANNLDDVTTVADDIVLIRSAPAAADNAADARDKAEAWADNAEDLEVEPGRFSARHHAAKAGAYRGDAEQAKTDAKSAEAQAQASRDAAVASESNAAASESAAAQSESNAAASETNAAQSASQAAISLDVFTDAFLGARTADPATDNDGDPLEAGTLYYNESTGALRVYTGSAWIDAINASTALIGANNLADVDSASDSRANLGLGDIATQNAASIAITGGSITNTEIDLGAVS